MGATESMTDNVIVFENIYKNKLWSEAGNGSGTGSSIEETKNTINIIKNIIKKYSIKAMVDAPCGAMAWMPILLNEIDIKYIGLDVVGSVIEKNREKFKKWKFYQFDITKEVIPFECELILCRDTLQHLSYRMIIDALRNFSKSKAKYIILDSFINLDKNMNIETGQFFYINLLKEPFNLTNPISVFKENNDSCLLLYSIDYLKGLDFSSMLSS